jgi:putative hydrolase of the HAD superfamily
LGRPGDRPTPRVWLFDLDDTLHDASGAAFGGINEAMTAYIAERLSLTLEEAQALRTRYWRRYGVTLLGLLQHHDVSAPHFLEQTHRLPGLEDRLRRHPHDAAALKALRGWKVVLTNAPLAYAERVLRALGLRHLFDGLIPVERMRMFGHWRPKPDRRMFRQLLARLRVPASQCVLVEDTLDHQKAARAVGLKTVWMQRWGAAGRPGVPPPRRRRRPAYVHARIGSLQRLRRHRW